MTLIFSVAATLNVVAKPGSVLPISVNEQYLDVSYCDLIRDVNKYRGKMVRVTAIYRYGFEWSELYCPECLNEARIWVDFDESFDTSTRPSVRRKVTGNGSIGRTVSVVMVGRFDEGGYGHMGAHRFRLLVNRLDKASVILNDSSSPEALPKKVLNKLHCSEIGNQH